MVGYTCFMSYRCFKWSRYGRELWSFFQNLREIVYWHLLATICFKPLLYIYIYRSLEFECQPPSNNLLGHNESQHAIASHHWDTMLLVGAGAPRTLMAGCWTFLKRCALAAVSSQTQPVVELGVLVCWPEKSSMILKGYCFDSFLEGWI